MSNAFKNYTNLSSALQEANDTKDSAMQKIEETKEKAALTGKSLGELKSAITSKSALTKVWKNTIKPKIKAKLDKVAKEKLENLKDNFKKGPADDSLDDDADAGSGGAATEETTTEDLANGVSEAPSYDDLLARSTESAADRFAKSFGDPESTEPVSGLSDDEATSLMQKGLSRASNFESNVASGTAEGEELTPEVEAASKLAGNSALQTLSDWRGSNASGFSQAKSSFGDSDIGETGNVYDRTTGLTEDETNQLGNLPADEEGELVKTGLSRASDFGTRVASGEAEGEELTPEVEAASKLAGNPELQTLSDWRGSNAEGFSQAKNTFTDSDLGESGNVYERSSGLTEDESGQLSNWFTSKGNTADSDDLGELADNFGSRVGNLSSTVSNLRTAATTPVTEDVEGQVAKVGAKVVAKAAGEEGGGEVASGILDAIPGLDIIGAISGAVLAGVMGHKEHKEARLEQNQDSQSSSTTFVDQAGVGGE